MALCFAERTPAFAESPGGYAPKIVRHNYIHIVADVFLMYFASVPDFNPSMEEAKLTAALLDADDRVLLAFDRDRPRVPRITARVSANPSFIHFDCASQRLPGKPPSSRP